VHEGKKVGILIESDFYEHEIWYYHYRFREEGIDLRFLTRLWTEGKPAEERQRLRQQGLEVQRFRGHEYHAPFECRGSFLDIDDAELRTYAAVIVPSGMVADRLRYTEVEFPTKSGHGVKG
jgi:protease I